MIKFNSKKFILQISLSGTSLKKILTIFEEYAFVILLLILTGVSVIYFTNFYQNGLGLAYNDARSHLDIGRRVVEGLKPGVAQLGSVWLPLPHILMIPTIWSDFMWHSGLSGALVSMISFIATGLLIYQFLKLIGVGLLGRIVGVAIFVLNLNILYLQSTAMTELLLIALTIISTYYLVLWSKNDAIINLIKAAFFAMLATLTRYDGWLLFILMAALIFIRTITKKGYKTTEGMIIFFCTLGGFGIFLWLLWNQLIFKDALFFAFGPYSARSQQSQLETAGILVTKGNIFYSVKTYMYALFYNIGTFTAILGGLGAILFWLDKKITKDIRLASVALTAPLIFNIIALYFGHSVLFIQGISGNTWFNARYGIMMIPTVAIFIGFLVHKFKKLQLVLIGMLLLVTFFSFTSDDAVTIDDARVGSSQKNVTEVSGWLKQNTALKDGFILISAASHDAIIFSSGLPMKKYIHEGTGAYWESATTSPKNWARWIIMRTYDNNDITYKAVSKTPDLIFYDLVGKYPFADIYQLKDIYLKDLNTQPILGKQK